MNMDYSKIEVLDIEINGDYPDFTDSFILDANYDGKSMNDQMLDELNNDSDFIYNLVIDRIF